MALLELPLQSVGTSTEEYLFPTNSETETERESCKFHDIPEHWDLFSSSKKGVFQSEGKKENN